MIYYVMIICAVIGTLFVGLWAFMFIKYKETYEGLLSEIDGKGFTFKEIYFIGLGAIEAFEKVANKKITTTDKAVEQMKKLAEIYGRENAELYYYIMIAAKISMIVTFIPLALLLCGAMKSVVGLFLGALVGFVMVYGVQSSINAAVEQKKDAIVSEFPKMVSKLTLLINAGMLVRRAWDEVAESDYESPLYAEMRTTTKDLQEGMSIDAALDSFAQRCGTKQIRKFASIYVQAVNRGASESINSMKIMAEEAWVQKRQYSKQKGELASQKLLVPNMIMFLGILIIVVVPIFGSMFSNIKS